MAANGVPLMLLGGLPFAAGAVLPPPGDPDAAALPCPFRAATGLPCPLCGSTRAVVLLAHGDPAFLRFNAVVALVLIAVALAGAWRWLGRPLPRLQGRALAATVAVGLAAAWAWALLHRDAIVA